MVSRKVSTARLELVFGGDPFTIRALRNRATGETVAGVAAQSFLIRTPRRVSDPVFLTEVQAFDLHDGVARAELTDATGEYRLHVSVTPDEEGLAFTVDAEAPVSLWMVEWKLTGLDLEEMILPALGGQTLKKSMPPDTTLSYKYPFWWNAQFVIGAARGGGIWLRTLDAGPKFKLIRIRREHERFSVTFGFEADGPLSARTLHARWYLDAYRGTWKTPVNRHREWMQEVFDLHPLASHSLCPPWLQDINVVLEIWGMAKDRPVPLHTFDDMQRRLRAFSRLHNPGKTLVYLPGFAEHGIDSRAPSYHPSTYLGGEAKFHALIETAHWMGYRVMIHTNVLAMTFDHPLFDRFRQHQVVDVFGREQGWGLDIDGDWLPEPFFAYINPGEPAWGDLMEKVLGDLIREYGIDGVFLDQTLLAFNLARGPNFVTGMRDHVLRLRRAFPDTLFAGEGYHEIVAKALPMAQIHGIDSIAGVHGMEGRTRWRVAHPVSTYLFQPFTKFTAHLLTRHPSHPLFGMQEEAYERLNVIPAVCLYHKDQKLDMPAVRRMLKRATKL